MVAEAKIDRDTASGWSEVGEGLTFWLSPRFSVGKLHPEVEEALEVVGQRHQRPFQTSLGQAAQREAAKAQRGFDDPKDRFDRLLALPIAEPSGFRGHAMGHLIEERRLR